MTVELFKLKEVDFKKIYTLMERSFPPEEVRSYENGVKILSDPNYRILISINEDGEILGFIAEWDLGSTIFLEHFAVDQTLRGLGIGSGMMAAYLSQVIKPVMLEVEDEKTAINERRIVFYQRLGFYLSEYGYQQPVMRGDVSKAISLRIMSYPDPLTKDDFYNFRHQVFTQIYKSIETDS
nr:GNAT family N-acetyltransferase [uncultured Acetobacterium sp.]